MQAVFILLWRVFSNINEGAIVAAHIAQAQEEIQEEGQGKTLRDQKSAQKRYLCRDRCQVVYLATEAV